MRKISAPFPSFERGREHVETSSPKAKLISTASQTQHQLTFLKERRQLVPSQVILPCEAKSKQGAPWGTLSWPYRKQALPSTAIAPKATMGDDRQLNASKVRYRSKQALKQTFD
eukprot:6183361-Pleurochrysis_carterae.AAC.1